MRLMGRGVFVEGSDDIRKAQLTVRAEGQGCGGGGEEWTLS